jgi:hypothetical protein
MNVWFYKHSHLLLSVFRQQRNVAGKRKRKKQPKKKEDKIVSLFKRAIEPSLNRELQINKICKNDSNKNSNSIH